MTEYLENTLCTGPGNRWWRGGQQALCYVRTVPFSLLYAICQSIVS